MRFCTDASICALIKVGGAKRKSLLTSNAMALLSGRMVFQWGGGSPLSIGWPNDMSTHPVIYGLAIRMIEGELWLFSLWMKIWKRPLTAPTRCSINPNKMAATVSPKVDLSAAFKSSLCANVHSCCVRSARMFSP